MEANRKAAADPSREILPPAAAPLARTRFVDPLLDPRAEDLRLAGRSVGQVVTLGERVQLFTTQPGLAELDGQVFADRATLAAAVREALSGTAAEGAAALPRCLGGGLRQQRPEPHAASGMAPPDPGRRLACAAR